MLLVSHVDGTAARQCCTCAAHFDWHPGYSCYAYHKPSIVGAYTQDLMKPKFGDAMLVRLVMIVSSKHQASGIAPWKAGLYVHVAWLNTSSVSQT